MNSGAQGINSPLLEAAINELKSNLEIIKGSFNEIEGLVDNSSSYFKGDIGDAFRKKSKNMIYTFPTIEGNIESYIEDLTNYLNNYQLFESGYTVDNNNAEV